MAVDESVVKCAAKRPIAVANMKEASRNCAIPLGLSQAGGPTICFVSSVHGRINSPKIATPTVVT